MPQTGVDDESPRPSQFRGPRRAAGPVGPDAVRRAVLDAAAGLFADEGIAATTRRDVAAAANVDPNLINRYIGSRSDLVAAVLDDLALQLSAELVAGQLDRASHHPDSVIMRWVRVMSQVVAARNQEVGVGAWNPVQAISSIGVAQFGLDPAEARIRAALVTALSFGWRLLEPYLLEAGELADVPLDDLRVTLNEVNISILRRRQAP